MKKLLQEFFSNLSQTFFVGKPLNGALLFGIVLVAIPRQALAGLFCGLLTILVARYLKPNKTLTDGGLFGMNGFFFGVAFVSLFTLNAAAPFWLAAGAILSAVATLFLYRLFQHWQFPILVLPYMLSIQLIWAMRSDTPTLIPIPFTPKTFESLSTLEVFGLGFINSFSEIFYQSNPWLGLAILIFLAFTNYRILLSGLAGGALANTVAVILGLAPAGIVSGFWGFSGVLVAIALSVGFSGVERPKIVVATLLSVVMMATLARAAYGIGLLPLGIPYLMTVWIFLTIASRQAKPVLLPIQVPWGRLGKAS